jgi:hypothetical protein
LAVVGLPSAEELSLLVLVAAMVMASGLVEAMLSSVQHHQ